MAEITSNKVVMNREIKATLLKIELQIGLIHLDEVIQWCEEQLIYCDENDADLAELASISSQSNRDDVTEVLNIIGRVYDDSVAQALIQDFSLRVAHCESEFIKIAHCMEYLELIDINTMARKGAYFKCSIEDIEKGIYGDINLLRTELLEYLKNKTTEVSN